MTQRKRPLRAVGPGEKSKTVVAQSVEDAAASGSYHDLLIAMRERIAKTVSSESCPPRELAALANRLQAIAKEIEQLDRRKQQEDGDDGVAEDEEWDASAV